METNEELDEEHALMSSSKTDLKPIVITALSRLTNYSSSSEKEEARENKRSNQNQASNSSASMRDEDDPYKEMLDNGEIPIIDPHHHIFEKREGFKPNQRPLRYQLTYGKAPIDGYMFDDLLRDTRNISPFRVIGTVYLEAHSFYDWENLKVHLQPVGESVAIQRAYEAIESENVKRKKKDNIDANMISKNDNCLIGRGIICHADLMSEHFEEVLKTHLEKAPNVRGIRYSLAWDQDKEGIYRSVGSARISNNKLYHQNLDILEKSGLSYDVFVYHTQIDEVAEIAKLHPNLTIVLDHVGVPVRIRNYIDNLEQVQRQWMQSISNISKCPNVMVKIGGMTMAVSGYFGTLNDSSKRMVADSDAILKELGPWYKYAIQQFGAKRCMFESNFPMDKTSCSYRSFWNGMWKIANDCFFDASEKEFQESLRYLFFQTANETYRLGFKVPPLGLYRRRTSFRSSL